ncbi:uncharacterized protein A4U43_C09F16020 [Asparagus officinalis]|uniref:Uncharacterized protein n=1 Tax=Asparagus officinalis TaxID=4686 RepID=A0A5P1EB32_ASPOF|nr:uncharacterized protein A4U43_C09F16020 [Asparagus officinalis]
MYRRFLTGGTLRPSALQRRPRRFRHYTHQPPHVSPSLPPASGSSATSSSYSAVDLAIANCGAKSRSSDIPSRRRRRGRLILSGNVDVLVSCPGQPAAALPFRLADAGIVPGLPQPSHHPPVCTTSGSGRAQRSPSRLTPRPAQASGLSGRRCQKTRARPRSLRAMRLLPSNAAAARRLWRCSRAMHAAPSSAVSWSAVERMRGRARNRRGSRRRRARCRCRLGCVAGGEASLRLCRRGGRIPASAL